MPSSHFAATAVLVFPALYTGRLLSAVALVYALLMGVALVYLGERYVLDLIVGGLFAAIGWIFAARVLAPLEKAPNP